MLPTLEQFIKCSPTAFHAVNFCKEILTSNGFTELYEYETWTLEKGEKYFTTRNGSSLIAFKVPENNLNGYMIAASHSDSPSFKLKENHMAADNAYTKLSTEKYGGMLCSTWLDRPLGIAGRIVVSDDTGVIKSKLVDFEDIALIPNVAIHLTRKAEEKDSYNAAVDMIPIVSTELDSLLSKSVSEDKLLSKDLFLYNNQNACVWGEFISAPRLDDLQCAYATLNALISSENNKNACPVFALFDNEEVGSTTKQGAASTFLSDTLKRISKHYNVCNKQMLASSFMLSCDNAHAVHPNHPEYSDKNNAVYMNKGVVIKYNANQKYTSDAISSGIFKTLCDKANVPYQVYSNRSDIPGGSTLGNISTTQISINAVDIGIAQLAMHSSYETAGIKDTTYMTSAVKYFFEHYIEVYKQNYTVK